MRRLLQEGKSAKRMALKCLALARQELAAAHDAITTWLYVKHLAALFLNCFGIYTSLQYNTLVHPSNSDDTQISEISVQLQEQNTAPITPKRRLSQHYLDEARQIKFEAYLQSKQAELSSFQSRPPSASANKNKKKVAPSIEPYYHADLLLDQRINSSLRRKSVSPSQNIILTSFNIKNVPKSKKKKNLNFDT
jgi:hypothetical protein